MRINMEDINNELIDISCEEDNIFLKGTIYFSENTPERAPFIINLAGLYDHRESYFVKYFSEKFASEGFYVLAYDHRAHGETKKQTGSNWLKQIIKIFSDINTVISWILEKQKDRIFSDKVALFGRSLGGAMILTKGFLDPRAYKLIALCARFDYHTTQTKFPEDIVQQISPMNYLKNNPENLNRILIAHCKDDQRIPYTNLKQIKDQLGLADENVLDFDSGGHSFKGHREDIVKRVIEFL